MTNNLSNDKFLGPDSSARMGHAMSSKKGLMPGFGQHFLTSSNLWDKYVYRRNLGADSLNDSDGCHYAPVSQAPWAGNRGDVHVAGRAMHCPPVTISVFSFYTYCHTLSLED